MACLLFACWAEARLLTATRVPIWLDKWLMEDHMANENRAEAGVGDGGSCRRGLVGEDIANMCNKTCAVPLSHLGVFVCVC